MFKRVFESECLKSEYLTTQNTLFKAVFVILTGISTINS